MDLKPNRLQAFLIVFLIWAAIYLPYLGRPKMKGEECNRAMPATQMLEISNMIAIVTCVFIVSPTLFYAAASATAAAATAMFIPSLRTTRRPI